MPGLLLISLCIHEIDVMGPRRQLCSVQRLDMEVWSPDHILKSFPPGQLLFRALRRMNEVSKALVSQMALVVSHLHMQMMGLKQPALDG